MTDITLASAIAKLREDLASAQAQGESQKIRLAVREVQVELALVVKASDELGGGIKAWFVEASAKTGTSHETGHKIILKLEPEPGSGELLVSRSQLEPE